MKIKTDFTTNSSRSSFVVLTKEKLTDKRLLDVFKDLVGASKLFPNLYKDIAESFLGNMEKTSVECILEDYGYDGLNEAVESDNSFLSTISEHISEYPHLYTGSFFDDDSSDRMGALLCDIDIEYKDKNIVIYKEGGY